MQGGYLTSVGGAAKADLDQRTYPFPYLTMDRFLSRVAFQILASETCDPALSVEQLAALTDGKSGSDLKELCRDAARNSVAFKDGKDEVSPEHPSLSAYLF